MIFPEVGLCTPDMVLIKVDLPGPVVAQKAMALARPDVETHPVQRDDRAEMLGDFGHRDDGIVIEAAHLTAPP
jgi:hypothetical protein